VELSFALPFFAAFFPFFFAFFLALGKLQPHQRVLQDSDMNS
jgi:hypothetical protein